MKNLYPSPVFGPVHSRRLGVSLGINLLPADGKVCSFDCIYCECGYNNNFRPHARMPRRKEVKEALRKTLEDMRNNGPTPDVITFAGNGEPTAHPHFPEILDEVIKLRDEFFPECKISVLSNATRILNPNVFEALKRVDNNILKLDTVSLSYIKMVDRPVAPKYNLEGIIAKMREYGKQCIIQTMFLKGTHEGKDVSNLSDDFVQPWLDAIRYIAPSKVMIYTIDRPTPSPLLKKATKEELDNIAERVCALGLDCQVSY